MMNPTRDRREKVDRPHRLEQMLRAKRKILAETLGRRLGQQVGEDVLAAVDETIEIGDRSVAALAQDVEIGLLEIKRREVRQIDGALRRLAAGTYGLCERCDGEIDEERLEILPFAPLCVDCQRRKENEEKILEATGQDLRSGFRDVREGEE